MSTKSNGASRTVKDKRLAKGRGKGEGANYKPYISVRDFSSIGQSNRVLGWKTGRQHDLFSLLELRYFYNLEWSLVVTDIQEQYPLPLEITLAIAKQCGISHPINVKTKEPAVMTTDFVITVKQAIGFAKYARTVKPAMQLQKPRTLEKFEIERRFWKAQGRDWGIVTENEIDKTLAKNMEWIHGHLHVSSLHPISEQLVQRIAVALTEMVTGSDRPLRDLTLECDDRLGLEPGRSLSVVRHLIASRQWYVDMTQEIHPCRRIILAKVALAEPFVRKGAA